MTEPEPTDASTPSAEDLGPLTHKVLEYDRTMKRLVTEPSRLRLIGHR